MKGFKLNENGDVVIANDEIELISDDELTQQTIKTVLNTNKGEWFANKDEGINFRAILGKATVQNSSKTNSNRQYEQEIAYLRDKLGYFNNLNQKLERRLTGE